MTCTYDRDRLSLLVSDELEPHEAANAEAHLATCDDCRRIVAQYRAGVLLLQAPATTVPYRRPVAAARRRPVWLGAAAAAAVAAAAVLALNPGARTALAELLGFPVHQVRENVITWHVPGYREQTDANDIRMEQTVNPGPGERIYTDSLDEVRRLVGDEVLLPPSLGSATASVFRNVDEQGRIRYAYVEAYGLLEDTATHTSPGWYEAQYWPNGQLEQTKLTFGTNWQVRTEDTKIGELPARIIKGENAVTNEIHIEVWLYRGDWLYKLKSHNPMVPLERLLEAAASLR